MESQYIRNTDDFNGIAYPPIICNTLFMVVRMRATRSHRNNRRSHHALDAARFSVCSNCKASHKSHTICMSCGWYNGRKVLDLAAKAVNKAKRKAAEAKK